MATPALIRLRRLYPKARLTVMAKSSIATLFTHDPHIDNFFILGDHETKKEIAERLKSHQFDYGLLLTNSFSSAWLFYKARIPYRVGYSKDMRGWLLSSKIPYPKEKTSEHMISTYLRLIEEKKSPKELLPELYLSEQEKSCAKKFLEKCEIFEDHVLIGINPGAAYGPSKCWLENRFRELSIKLLENPRVILFFFGDSQSEEKVKRISNDLGPRVFNLSGTTTLRQLMALINECDLFLTNDSGPMHMASALGTRTVALFGSTSPKATGPIRSARVIKKPVSCSPCFKRECPIDFRCMKSISVEEVHQTLLEELKIHT